MKLLLTLLILTTVTIYAEEKTINKDQHQLIEAAKQLGVLKNKENFNEIVKLEPLHSHKKITTLSKKYVKNNNFVNIKKYELTNIKFSKQEQSWTLFFMCKPTPEGGYTFGCHFIVLADNKKTPHFQFLRGR